MQVIILNILNQFNVNKINLITFTETPYSNKNLNKKLINLGFIASQLNLKESIFFSIFMLV